MVGNKHCKEHICLDLFYSFYPSHDEQNVLLTFSAGLRFTQWKERNTGASEMVLKKVPHCPVCHHPGEWSRRVSHKIIYQILHDAFCNTCFLMRIWKELWATGLGCFPTLLLFYHNLPGSTKVHERGGCALCKSDHFCHPQDFDYQCPCDWHRYEKTRQASSFESNIRKYVDNNQWALLIIENCTHM